MITVRASIVLSIVISSIECHLCAICVNQSVAFIKLLDDDTYWMWELRLMFLATKYES